jgi:hypothetical protein
MKTFFFDDFLIGGWAYARRNGASDYRACSLAVVQIDVFIMFTLIPWLVLLLKYLKFENSNIIYLIIGFGIILDFLFEIYVSKKGIFKNIDLHSEEVSGKIKKCTYFFIFLFFYMPLSTYITWPIMRQL